MSSEATLGERVAHLHRRLLLLQRLFQVSDGGDQAEWLGTGDKDSDLALCLGIREMLEEVTEHARILTTIPSPLSDWRPGDGPDDERWRALTEVERRELLSILNGYEKLIAWGDRVARPGVEPADASEAAAAAVRSRQVLRDLHEAPEYLIAERARIVRFREEMGFLERRRIPATP
jgi:hypothetical protein